MLVATVVSKRPPARARGDLLASAAAIAGAGTVSYIATGALLDGASVVIGAGISKSTGAGALVAQAAHVAGSGNAGNLVSGAGALADAPSTIAGVGVSKSTGTGALAAGASDVDGSGSVAILLKTSYANTGGTGDRTASITVTTTASLTNGTINNLVDGGVAQNATDSCAWTGGQSGREVKFDFGTGRYIRQARWKQDTTATHGTWKWQGSNDDSSYTDIGVAFTLGGVNGIQVLTTLIDNLTSYRYYKLLQTSGVTSNAPWLQEIEFFIDGATDTEGDTSYVYPYGGGTNAAGDTTGAGGNGVNRGTSLITVTANFSPPDGTLSNLVDGAAANNSTDSTDFPAALTNATIRFQFATKQRVDEITWEQQTTATHGNFDFEGSNDASSWTSIRTNFNLVNGAALNPSAFTNTTGYLYYRLKQVSGTCDVNPWLHEIYFKTVPSTIGTVI